MIVLILSVVMASPSLDMAVMDDDSLRVSTIGWQLLASQTNNSVTWSRLD